MSQVNFSFAGCGFLGIYHVGVAGCLRKFAQVEILNANFLGASAGSVAAVCLLCNAPLGKITTTVLKTVQDARSRMLGPFSPTFNVERLLREGLNDVLPRNAHEIVNGRLSISVTRVSDGKNVLLTKFDSFEELIQALICSAFLPIFSGFRPLTIKGVRYVDGGFTNNLPCRDSNTVTVSPFSGEADICPKDKNSGIMTVTLANVSMEISRENLYRFSFIVCPPPPHQMNRICKQGFNDTLEFLQRSFLFNNPRFLTVHSITKTNSNGMVENSKVACDEEYKCIECTMQREQALLFDHLPEAVGSLLQEGIDQANLKLSNWVFKNKANKLVSILSLPYSIPKDIGSVVLDKLLNSTVELGDLTRYPSKLIKLIKIFLSSWTSGTPRKHHKHPKRSDSFSCHVEITEFTGDDLDRPAIGDEKKNASEKETISLTETEVLSQLALRCAVKTLAVRPGSTLVSSRNASRGPSRAVSRAVSRIPSTEDLTGGSPEWDNYPQNSRDERSSRILDVTQQEEAFIMSYYYTDENNETILTEIFDLSENVPEEEMPLHDNEDQELLCEDVLQSHLGPFTEDYQEISSMNDTSTISPSMSIQNLDNHASEPEVDQIRK